MTLIAYVFAGLIAVAIMFIGTRFYWSPTAASRDFGIANPPAPSAGFAAWLTVKGTRDFASGLFVLLLMANGSERLLGEFLIVASLIAVGDAASVLRSGGKRAVAFGIHGVTALVIIATGACLIAAAG
ncbi:MULTISPECIES: DUF4267 domain-containing protein [unclassified Acidiphilium]|jgi:hypothetical protein|uniref:DUF4267 domain-containing protein n=1 Tax=unclassified Acidiphilium TaxID=2617493 RepID=UPI000BD1ADA5|nr:MULTISPECIES: DUF4267 domain-containing protein [unclassified Acidiphilium]OZB22286.1 MAG: hypothetical protein B7X49_17125 [Acidiphilium sp. 34-64-41]